MNVISNEISFLTNNKLNQNNIASLTEDTNSSLSFQTMLNQTCLNQDSNAQVDSQKTESSYKKESLEKDNKSEEKKQKINEEEKSESEENVNNIQNLDQDAKQVSKEKDDFDSTQKDGNESTKVASSILNISDKIQNKSNNLFSIEKNTKDVKVDFDLDNLAKGSKTSKNINTEQSKKSMFTVKDFRTQKEINESLIAQKKNDAKTNLDIKLDNSGNATITMDYGFTNDEQTNSILNNTNSINQDNNFQSMLSNQIGQNASEIAKTGTIILKDNKSGSINLVLHPDDLGNVKIHLSLDGKTLSGHIIVATKEAAEVFKDNAQTLREAFEQNGFDTSNFNVSYNNSQNMSNSGQEYSPNEFLARNIYETNDSFVEENIFELEAKNISKNDDFSINIVA